ncbi:MAG TPA: hypothetical protein VKB67_13880 [Rhizomicrobium sp.]|nr:hypothetical protein [Rhizomicrobium sp.]
MTKFRSAFLAVAWLSATTNMAFAQIGTGDPSAYLRCDGNPAHRSAGELLGRVLLLTATLGLAGRGEVQDVSKLAYGIDGVNACDAALLGESDPIRKVQLMLARSIHHVEAKDYPAALEDARTAPSLAGDAANDIGFQHSLLVSSLELQAASLVREGNFSEAEGMALRMANTSPYDVIAQIRAIPYAQLTAELTPEKQAYLDRLVKIFPEALGIRAMAYQWAGKYPEAAADYANIVDLRIGFSPDNNAPPPSPDVLALRSVMLALGGKIAESTDVAAETSAMVRVITASGKAGLMQSSIEVAEQALDFQAIVVELTAGHDSAARTKFAARSHWLVPATPAVADLAARLRQDAPAGDLIGPLATNPAAMRTDGLVANAGALTAASNADVSLYTAIRPPMNAATYNSWTDDVWDTKSSIFLHQRTANDNYIGELMVVPRTPGFFKPPHVITIAAGDALLMHSALMAQTRGDKGFELFPGRRQLDALLIRFGNPGDPGMPPAATFDAATVIADLSVEFPEPRARGATGKSSEHAN